MTATATDTKVPAAAAWLKVARLQVRPWSYTNLAWFWVTMAVVTICITVVTTIDSDGPDGSIWDWLLAGPMYYLLAVSIMMTLQVGLYVSHGVTRRDTVLGLQAFLAVASIGFGLMTALFFAIEAVVYDSLGWNHAIGLGQPLTTSTDWSGILFSTIPGHLAWVVSGQLLTLTYQRWGASRGTLALPLTLLPGLASSWLIGAAFDRSRGSWPLELPLATVLVLALVLVAGVAVHVIARELPIRTNPG